MQNKKKTILSDSTKEGDYEKALAGLNADEVEFLFLVEYDLSNLNIDRLVEQLKINTSLKFLEFKKCKIDDYSIIKLFEGLTYNTTIFGGQTSLTTIKILGNASCIQITDTAALHIANYLATNTSITSLIIQDSQIQAAGAKALAEALNTNTTMSEMHIGGQNITSEGARALWTAASGKSSRIVSFVTCPFANEEWYEQSVGKVSFKKAIANQAAARWLKYKNGEEASIKYADVFDNFSAAIKSYLIEMGRRDLSASYDAEVKALNR